MSDIYASKPEGTINGWNWLYDSDSWHYFVEKMSLCRMARRPEALLNCDDDPKTDDAPNNCPKCMAKIAEYRLSIQKPIDPNPPQA